MSGCDDSRAAAPRPAPFAPACKLDGADLAAVLHSMEEYALAFDTFSEGERILFIPKETLANLNNSEERPAGGSRPAGSRRMPPERYSRADTTFLWDLAVMASDRASA